METIEFRIREILADLYYPAGVDVWLDAPNQMLDNERPNDLIERGDGLRVLQLVEALAGGAYL